MQKNEQSDSEGGDGAVGKWVAAGRTGDLVQKGPGGAWEAPTADWQAESLLPLGGCSWGASVVIGVTSCQGPALHASLTGD